MKLKGYLVPGVLALLILLAGAVAFAKQIEYETKLSGANEIPMRVTGAKGEATVKLDKSGTKLHFKLEVEDIHNVWMSHFHMAPAGSNGPIVVWLFPRQAPPPASALPGEFEGKLAEGDITAADLTGPLAGQSLTDLINAINAGNIYVNVHTNDFVAPADTGPGDFPGGEIQIGRAHV